MGRSSEDGRLLLVVCLDGFLLVIYTDPKGVCKVAFEFILFSIHENTSFTNVRKDRSFFSLE